LIYSSNTAFWNWDIVIFMGIIKYMYIRFIFVEKISFWFIISRYLHVAQNYNVAYSFILAWNLVSMTLEEEPRLRVFGKRNPD
jgi:hypothetical protein